MTRRTLAKMFKRQFRVGASFGKKYCLTFEITKESPTPPRQTTCQEQIENIQVFDFEEVLCFVDNEHVVGRPGAFFVKQSVGNTCRQIPSPIFTAGALGGFLAGYLDQKAMECSAP